MASHPTSKHYHDIHRGWWNGKWYDSSWELALIVYYYDHNMELTRNTRKYPYKWYSRTEYYSPDFIDESGTYIEVKGIYDNKSKRKIASFPYPIKVMTYRSMKPYLDYMEQTYGKDWREKL